MTSTDAFPTRRHRFASLIPQKYVPILMTLALLVSMFTIGSIRYPGFATGQVILNVFIDNAFLLVVAVGMTFVILTGGIDLSVGAVVALSTLMLALLVKHGWPTLLAIVVVLVIGATLGWRWGLSSTTSRSSRSSSRSPGCSSPAASATRSPSTPSRSRSPATSRSRSTRSIFRATLYVTPAVVIALVAVLVGVYVLHYTRLGRNVYAIGGNEQSALLMGLPVAGRRSPSTRSAASARRSAA